MSIYGTWFMLDQDHEHECQKWQEDVDERDCYHFNDNYPCTCGLPNAPLVYEGSHVLPGPDSRKGGHLEVGGIPDHITRDGRDDAPEGALKDWVRIGVGAEPSDEQYEGKPYVAGGHATVVLTRPQVERLRDTLTTWLDRKGQ